MGLIHDFVFGEPDRKCSWCGFSVPKTDPLEKNICNVCHLMRKQSEKKYNIHIIGYGKEITYNGVNNIQRYSGNNLSFMCDGKYIQVSIRSMNLIIEEV